MGLQFQIANGLAINADRIGLTSTWFKHIHRWMEFKGVHRWLMAPPEIAYRKIHMHGEAQKVTDGIGYVRGRWTLIVVGGGRKAVL